MEDAGQQFQLVHILRHTFKPSQKLGETLQIFNPPGSERPRSLLSIKSLSMIGLNPVEVANNKFSNEILAAQKYVESKQGRSFEIIPTVDVRRIGEKSLAILMGVKNNEALVSFMQVARNKLPKGVTISDPGQPQFSLYARVDSALPIPDDFEQQAAHDFNEIYYSIARPNLFYVLPSRLVGADQSRRVRPRDDLEQAS